MGQVSTLEDEIERRGDVEPIVRLRRFVSVLDGLSVNATFPEHKLGLSLNDLSGKEFDALLDKLAAARSNPSLSSRTFKKFTSSNEAHATAVYELVCFLAPKILKMRHGSDKRRWQRIVEQLKRSSLFKAKKY